LTRLQPFAILNSKFHLTHVGFLLDNRGGNTPRALELET